MGNQFRDYRLIKPGFSHGVVVGRIPQVMKVEVFDTSLL